MKQIQISQTSYNALVWCAREFFEGLDLDVYDKAEIQAATDALAEEPIIIEETSKGKVKYTPASQNAERIQPDITEADLKGEEPTRYAALRLWRKDIAAEANLPEFMIFPNKTLMAIAQAHPCTLQDLIKVKGVGDDKMRRYGDDVTAIMCAFN